jgi:hypothetical protein
MVLRFDTQTVRNRGDQGHELGDLMLSLVIERDLFGQVVLVRSWGRIGARGMAAELNRRGVETAAGGQWHAQTVIRAMQRVIV